MAEFNVKDFLGVLKTLKTYSGTDNSYVVVGTAKGSELAFAIDLGQSAVQYEGKPIHALGFGFRVIQVGENPVFINAIGMRNYTPFKGEDGEVYKGARLIRTFLPVVNYPCSGSGFAELAGVAIDKLADYLFAQVAAVGGKATATKEDLVAYMKTQLDSIDTSIYDLFHLPGETPAWAKSNALKTQSGIAGEQDGPGNGPDADETDNDDHEDD